MKNVSREFIKTLEARRDFYYTAAITFKDGRKVELNRNGLAAQGNSIVVSPESNAFPLGFAIAKRLTLQILNQYEQYSDYDFFDALIQVYLKFDLSKNTEIINLGKYTVVEPETYGSTITLTAVDDMYKADRDYTTSLTYPRAMGEVLRDSCASCNLTLLTSNITNSDYVIKKKPENLTHRQFIGLCAMIAGGNAIADEFGRIKIITYNLAAFERTSACDGGMFDQDTPYSSGDRANGGNFYPWDTGSILDAGSFSYMDDYHVFYQHQNPTVSTDDVQITGVRTVIEEQVFMSGLEGYVLNIENQLVKGNEQDALNRIGGLLIGLKFRPFTTDHTCYPLADFGDPCYVVDRKNNVYQSVITDIDFDFKGFTIIKCSADSPIRNSSKYQPNSMTQAIIKARVNTEKQISDYDRAVQMMTSIMANSLGMFTTAEETENGGQVVYQHNKPELEDSDIIWKKSEQGFTVSTNGGKSWNAGITADGSAAVNILSAIGINADWINTRGFKAKDNAGNITFEINESTGGVTISASSFKLSGKTIEQLVNLGITEYDSTLSQAEIFNKLTNNGEEQGIYLKNGKLYLNFSYALGGAITLGKKDNTAGIIRVLDASGNEVGRWDGSEGLKILKGIISGSTISLGGNNNVRGKLEAYYENGNLLLRLDRNGLVLYDIDTANILGHIGINWYADGQKGLAMDIREDTPYLEWTMKKNDGTSEIILRYMNEKYSPGAYGIFAYKPFQLGAYMYTRGWDIFFGDAGKVHHRENGMSIFAFEGKSILMGGDAKYTLRIDNDITIYSTKAGMIDCYNNIDMHGFSLTNTSDERLKANIKPCSKTTLDIINKIRLYEFDWLTDGSHEDIGHIAQQVETIAPDLAYYNEKTDVFSVKESRMIRYLWKAVQELSDKVEKLERIVDTNTVSVFEKNKNQKEWKPTLYDLEKKEKFTSVYLKLQQPDLGKPVVHNPDVDTELRRG